MNKIKKWSKKEDALLKKVWNVLDKAEILKLFKGRTWMALGSRAKSLNIKTRNKKFWTTQDKDKLKEMWGDSKLDDIYNVFPGRTYNSISQAAKNLNLRRDMSSPNVNSQLANCYINGVPTIDNLLKETPEAYYWIGFLMADGHFSNDGLITINLSVKDLEHLKKLAKFFNLKKIHKVKKSLSEKYHLTIKNLKIVPLIVNKFNLNPNKTYKPPKVCIKNDDLFLSFLIGFIDGDGCIRNLGKSKRCIIKIQCHASWKNNLKEWMDRMLSLSGVECYGDLISNKANVRMETKMGGFTKKLSTFATVECAISEVLVFLKNKTTSLNLPVMERKWSKVPTFFNNIRGRALIKRRKIIELYKMGLTQAEICRKLNVASSTVSMTINGKNIT